VKRSVVRILTALFVIGLIRGGYGLIAAWRQSPYSAANLRATSEQINRMLPAYIGTEMQLVHTSAGERRFVYSLRLINYKGRGQELESTGTREALRKSACADEKTRDLLRHQVHLLYQIEASDARPLVAIEIAPGDCGS
jgi:hypothetical protein